VLESRISKTVRVDYSCVLESRIPKTVRVDYSCVLEGRILKTVRVDLAIRHLRLAGVKHVYNMSEWIVLKDTRKSM
jgi:hypothetical protein